MRPPGVDPAKREQLKFAARTLVEALSPAHFPLTNPVVMQARDRDQGRKPGQGDGAPARAICSRGQLTHVDPDAFKVGENIAATPGKVVHETPLYQLIQYSPTTDDVLEVPLVIFPPWINRFYILDLNPQKSFIRWAVEQGVTRVRGLVEIGRREHGRRGLGRLHPRRRSMRSTRSARGWMCRRSTPSAIASPGPRWPRRWRCWPGAARRTRSRARLSSPPRSISKRPASSRCSSTTSSSRRSTKLSDDNGYLDGRYDGGDLQPAARQRPDLELRGQELPAGRGLSGVRPAPLERRCHQPAGQVAQSYLKDLYRDNKLVVPDALERRWHPDRPDPDRDPGLYPGRARGSHRPGRKASGG